jgi:replicative DNA helicase
MQKGKAEIIIGKHRHGSTGTINLSWLGEYTRFENYISDIGIESQTPSVKR